MKLPSTNPTRIGGCAQPIPRVSLPPPTKAPDEPTPSFFRSSGLRIAKRSLQQLPVAVAAVLLAATPVTSWSAPNVVGVERSATSTSRVESGTEDGARDAAVALVHAAMKRVSHRRDLSPTHDSLVLGQLGQRGTLDAGVLRLLGVDSYYSFNYSAYITGYEAKTGVYFFLLPRVVGLGSESPFVGMAATPSGYTVAVAGFEGSTADWLAKLLGKEGLSYGQLQWHVDADAQAYGAGEATGLFNALRHARSSSAPR